VYIVIDGCMQCNNSASYFLEQIAAAKKPVRIEDQEVRDENGRRRFHGAFTGGFSAGYYNTGMYCQYCNLFLLFEVFFN